MARRRRLRRAGALVAFAVVVAALSAAVLVLLREPAGPGEGGPALATAVELRAAPERAAATLATLPAGTPLRLSGRSPDGAWLLVAPAERPELSGWVPVAAVRDAGNLEPLVRVTPPAVATAAATAGAGSGDLPDLVVQAAGSRQNRLVVVVANLGSADAVGAVLVRVNGGPARRVDVAGKPLRPRDALEAVLTTEYVQRRAQVRVEVELETGEREARTDNNRLDVVVTPDVPNDLAIGTVEIDAIDGSLRVEVRNLSPIPVVGTVQLAVREAPPGTRLLGVAEAAVNLAPDAAERVAVREVRGVPLGRLVVHLATDAITDANPANDSYPR